MSPRIFFNTIKVRNKNIFFHGAVLAFFVIAVISTFIIGIYGFSRMGQVDWNYVPSMKNSTSAIAKNQTISNVTKTANTTTRFLDNFDQNAAATILSNPDSPNRTSPILENGTVINSMPLSISSYPFRISATPIINKTNSNYDGDDDLENDDDDSDGDIKVTFNIFTYTLPFVAFILDHSLKRLNSLPEKSLYIMIKLIAIIYYLGTYVLALQQPSVYSQYYIIVHTNFVIFPIVYVVYGYLLRAKKLG